MRLDLTVEGTRSALAMAVRRGQPSPTLRTDFFYGALLEFESVSLSDNPINEAHCVERSTRPGKSTFFPKALALRRPCCNNYQPVPLRNIQDDVAMRLV